MLLVYYEVESIVTKNKYHRHGLFKTMSEFWRKFNRRKIWNKDAVVIESVVER